MASLLATFYCLFVSLLVCRAQTTAAGVYVFSDSLVDVGNNNHLPLSLVKANFPYNGIDFSGNKATGRFSNGKNAADFLAERLGVSTPPPYLSQPNGTFVKGVSFASGGAGIFNTTDQSTISLPRQVGYFSTVSQRLAKEMGTKAAQEHLSKSLFPFVIGSNDIINYFQSNSDIGKKYTPQQYVTLIASNLKEMLKSRSTQVLVRGANPDRMCAQAKMLLELQSSELKDLNYSYFDTYNIFLDFIRNPSTYGFNETKSACCGLGKLRANLPCTPLAVFCSGRNGHVFWDVYHPTEAAVSIFIAKLFDASADYVSPITLQHLLSL
ncbi:GDSL esterase/lipase [Salvia divinorum]|uniref:GDSL esterase/lipase n=1 Tax=Salvia divinorum TaxID=28513 RepID=A0ABD1II43_SALDI